jgi:hypothetical protein
MHLHNSTSDVHALVPAANVTERVSDLIEHCLRQAIDSVFVECRMACLAVVKRLHERTWTLHQQRAACTCLRLATAVYPVFPVVICVFFMLMEHILSCSWCIHHIVFAATSTAIFFTGAAPTASTTISAATTATTTAQATTHVASLATHSSASGMSRATFAELVAEVDFEGVAARDLSARALAGLTQIVAHALARLAPLGATATGTSAHKRGDHTSARALLDSLELAVPVAEWLSGQVEQTARFIILAIRGPMLMPEPHHMHQVGSGGSSAVATKRAEGRSRHGKIFLMRAGPAAIEAWLDGLSRLHAVVPAVCGTEPAPSTSSSDIETLAPTTSTTTSGDGAAPLYPASLSPLQLPEFAIVAAQIAQGLAADRLAVWVTALHQHFPLAALHACGAAELAEAHQQCQTTQRLLVTHFVDLHASHWVEAIARAGLPSRVAVSAPAATASLPTPLPPIGQGSVSAPPRAVIKHFIKDMKTLEVELAGVLNVDATASAAGNRGRNSTTASVLSGSSAAMTRGIPGVSKGIERLFAKRVVVSTHIPMEAAAMIAAVMKVWLSLRVRGECVR